MNKLHKNRRSLFSALLLVLGCFNSTCTHASSGYSLKDMRKSFRDLECRYEGYKWVKQCPLYQSGKKEWRYDIYSEFEEPLGRVCTFVTVKSMWYDQIEGSIDSLKEFYCKIAEFRRDFIFDLPSEIQGIVGEIPETIDQLEKLYNDALPIDNRMEIFNYIVSFQTEEERLKKWEDFGIGARSFLYERLDKIVNKPSGKWTDDENYRQVRDLKEAIDKHTKRQLVQNRKVKTLFQFLPICRKKFIEDLDQVTLEGLLEDAIEYNLDTNEYFQEVSQKVTIHFVRDLWRKLNQSQQRKLCYHVWEKLSEATGSIRFAKEFMLKTLSKEFMKEIQESYRKNCRKQRRCRRQGAKSRELIQGRR